MSVRTSMAPLIAAVRTLVDDPILAASGAQLTDEQIQDALDHARTDVRFLELAPAADIAPGGAVSWLHYYAEVGSVGMGDWEADVVIQSNTFAYLTPATADYLVGHFVFATDTRPPVYLTGKTYDRYAAAVELLRVWLARVKLTSFDFSSDSQKFLLSQKREAIKDLIKEYLTMVRTTSLQMVRSDVPQELWQRRNFDISRTSF
jgi:hypothetical protein